MNPIVLHLFHFSHQWDEARQNTDYENQTLLYIGNMQSVQQDNLSFFYQHNNVFYTSTSSQSNTIEICPYNASQRALLVSHPLQRQ